MCHEKVNRYILNKEEIVNLLIVYLNLDLSTDKIELLCSKDYEYGTEDASLIIESERDIDDLILYGG